MTKVKDQYSALNKLEEFQQAKQSLNSQENPSLLFLTWPTIKFGIFITYFITLLIAFIQSYNMI